MNNAKNIFTQHGILKDKKGSFLIPNWLLQTRLTLGSGWSITVLFWADAN